MDDLMEKIQEVLSDEESMKQLSELAASLFPSPENADDKNKADNSKKAKSQNNNSCGETDFDIGSFMKIGQLMSTVTGDKNTELLLALKPLLKEERQERVDKAVKLLKLLAVYNVLKDSGMLEELF